MMLDALCAERIEIRRGCGDERFSFAGFHFGDAAFVKHHAADELNVEVPHIERAAAAFTNHREGFNHQSRPRDCRQPFDVEPDPVAGKPEAGASARTVDGPISITTICGVGGKKVRSISIIIKDIDARRAGVVERTRI